jgi:hypothetical protein
MRGLAGHRSSASIMDGSSVISVALGERPDRTHNRKSDLTCSCTRKWELWGPKAFQPHHGGCAIAVTHLRSLSDC